MNRIAFLKSLIISVLCYTIIISCTYPVSSNPSKNNSNLISIQTNYEDLFHAAEKSVHAVAHIKTEFMRRNSLWEELFGDRFLEEEDAQKITVTLNNKRAYNATEVELK